MGIVLLWAVFVQTGDWWADTNKELVHLPFLPPFFNPQQYNQSCIAAKNLEKNNPAVTLTTGLTYIFGGFDLCPL